MIRKIYINKDLLILQIMWLFVFLRIQYVSEGIRILIQLIGCIICAVYLFRHCSLKRSISMLPIFLFAGIGLFSVLHNFNSNGVYITFTGILFVLKVIEFFFVLNFVIAKTDLERTAKSLLNASFVFWIPSVISVLIQGRDVRDNASGVYFVGNKFAVAYLSVMMICFYGILIANNKKNGQYDKIHISTKMIKAFAFLLFSFYILIYMRAYTGVFMFAFIIVLLVLDMHFSHRDVHGNMAGFIQFLRNPITVVCAVFASGATTVCLDTIAQLPVISNFLISIGKDTTINSRVLIYKNLNSIISNKLLTGYGYNSPIVSQYYGPNAQNGLMNIIIYFGILGLVGMLFLVFMCIKAGNRTNSSSSKVIIFGIYAFILASTVEITYGNQFFFLLALYHATYCETKERRLEQ